MWTRMSEILFQSRCVFCQESAPPGRDICQFCVADLPVSQRSCLSCAMPLAEPVDTELCGDESQAFSRADAECSDPSPRKHSRCGLCLQQLPPVRQTLAYCHYAYPADFLVQQLKFARQLKYARVMGSLMVDTIESTEHSKLGSVDLIIPIPLSAKRYRTRGFNQASEIARFVADGLSKSTSDRILHRCQDQAPQAGLDRRQRRSNIRGAFQVQKKLDGEHCVLVDDVITTGATAYEAATTLLRAGAGIVDLWVFARTV